MSLFAQQLPRCLLRPAPLTSRVFFSWEGNASSEYSQKIPWTPAGLTKWKNMPSADFQERVMASMSVELEERNITGNMAIGSDRTS